MSAGITLLNGPTILAGGMLRTALPLNATSQFVQDNAGNTSALSLSTSLVGIGTATPLSQLEIKGNTDGALRISGSSSTESTRRALFSYFNTPDVCEIDVSNILRIKNGSIYSIYANSSGNVGINTLAPTAKLQVQGAGATSATTSLLVQNSAGTQMLKVADNSVLTLANSVTINPVTPSGTSVNINGANNNGGLALNVIGAGGLVATSTLGADQDNSPDGASIVAQGGSSLGRKSVGLRSNRALISAGFARDIVDSAMLQVDSTTQGFLAPRMTTTQRNAIVSPATGLQIYNTTLGTTDTYDGATWQSFGKSTFIKGSGATSATTSLLVQNSSGTTSFSVSDGGTGYFSNQVQIGAGNNVPNGSNALTVVGYGSYTFNFNNSTGFTFPGVEMTRNYIRLNGGGVKFIGNTEYGSNGSDLFLHAGYSPGNVNHNKVRIGTAYNGNIGREFAVFDMELRCLTLGTTTSDVSATLQADSTTKGFLPPRMTDAQARAIASPANGLIVYNTTINHLCVYQGGAWVRINHSPM